MSATLDRKLRQAAAAAAAGDHAATERLSREVLARAPRNPHALGWLGIALAAQGRHAEAAERLRGAVAADPANAGMHDHLGEALLQQGRESEAADSFRRALALQPDHPDFHCDLGNALSAQGRGDEAIPHYERALALDPAFAEARYSLAVALLFRHEFGRGWAQYERRGECPPMRASMRKNAATLDLFERLPRWRGPGTDAGGEIAIWSEQGIGDQVLYSTLIPELIAAGVPFVYEVDQRLKHAYERAFPGSRFVPLEEPPRDELQRASRVLLAGSLPGWFRAAPADFARQPARLLGAAPERVAHYRRELAALAPGTRVALSWRSTRQDYWGPKKTAPLVCFAPLLTRPGVSFVDVQYGDTAAERRAAEAATGVRLLHFDDVDYYNDLEELLAILEACDLLITTSNATAHFAGALGKRTWLMYLAERPPFHYWAHGGSHRSLWYPSVEVVSAPHLADWDSLIRHVAEKLASVQR